jgi:hypothetical protein
MKVGTFFLAQQFGGLEWTLIQSGCFVAHS